VQDGHTGRWLQQFNTNQNDSARKTRIEGQMETHYIKEDIA